MVRIISGRFRGRRLAVPAGKQVRPTTDRVREALFNVLVHRVGVELAGARVLDLFAGAGTLGLEALSRGATSAVFVEADNRAARVLAQNLAAAPDATLVRRKAASYLTQPPQPFDLIFLDPPYAKGHVQPTLDALRPWLAPGGTVCVDHDPSEAIAPPANLSLAFTRRYGASTISVLICALDPQD